MRGNLWACREGKDKKDGEHDSWIKLQVISQLLPRFDGYQNSTENIYDIFCKALIAVLLYLLVSAIVRTWVPGITLLIITQSIGTRGDTMKVTDYEKKIYTEEEFVICPVFVTLDSIHDFFHASCLILFRLCSSRNMFTYFNISLICFTCLESRTLRA